MLLVSVPEHVLEIPLELASQKKTSSDLLNLDDLLPPLIKVNLDIVPRSITSVKTLDEYTRRISLKDSPEAINVYLKVKKMLLSTLLLRVVWDMEFHEFV